jgi:hypothetical protein
MEAVCASYRSEQSMSALAALRESLSAEKRFLVELEKYRASARQQAARADKHQG